MLYTILYTIVAMVVCKNLNIDFFFFSSLLELLLLILCFYQLFIYFKSLPELPLVVRLSHVVHDAIPFQVVVRISFQKSRSIP